MTEPSLVRHGQTGWLDFPMALGQSFPVEGGRVSVLGTEKDSPAIIRWNS